MSNLGECQALPSSGVPLTVWLLQGKRLGDNQQVLALGATLEARFGWRLAVKHLKFVHGPALRADPDNILARVDLEKSDPIQAHDGEPWPDLIIAIGRRLAPVARWIAAQRKPAGIHVQLGRFHDPFDTVDLLVTTAQYGLPTASNVLHISLPIIVRKPEVLAAAAANFASIFASITGPVIGVLVGGPSNPVQFGAADAQRLVRESLAYAGARSGTLLVATSPRTPEPVLDVLRRELPAPHRLFVFEPGAGARNPYPALLAQADSFIVTSDSISMIADACLTGREIRLFDLPVKPRRALWKPSWPIQHWVGRRRIGRLAQGKPGDRLDAWFDAQVRAARAQPVRYVPTIINRLLRERHVTLLSSKSQAQSGIDQLMQWELDMVVARIVALLAERRAVGLREHLAEPASAATSTTSPRSDKMAADIAGADAALT